MDEGAASIRQGEAWAPVLSFEERLKHGLFPSRLYFAYRVHKELRKGEKELRLLPFLADANRMALDIGANKGVWTHVLRRLCTEVHAFEPNPKMFGLLKTGAGSNVSAHQVALSNETGEAEFRIPRNRKGYSNQGGSLSKIKVADNYGSLTVETLRLDELNLQNVGFMKIDVEGSELQVLEGAEQTIRRERPVMVIEMEERHTKRPIKEAIAVVEGYGYQAFALVDNILTDVRQIDLNARHREPRTMADYINNFIFLPA
ncbi:FkbM family methyltransferase [Parvibaculum sp.]|uniref:FkbM family methyltransferase n=1 Tax=Parvibaculum sp. TaxID=2024848 RepID=UPI0034A08225